MASSVTWNPAYINKRLDELKDPLGRRGGGNLAGQIREAIEEDNRDKIARGVDRNGRPLTPLLSKRKGQYKGKTGPPLAPSGLNSRVVTHFRTGYTKAGGAFKVFGGWVDVVSKRGVDFLPFHFDGLGHNPRRDLAGITPRGRAAIRRLIAEFLRRRGYRE